jgi:hypothetical protein
VGDCLPSNYLPFLQDDLIPEFVNFYRSAFNEYAQGSSICTTTTPGYVSSVPAILSALPNAKFIFMKRDHQDIALRMFFRHYKNANFHSYDFTWALNYIKWYYELVDIWQAKFPKSVITIEYKTLLAQPDEQLKIILDFIGVKQAAPKSFAYPDDIGFSKPYQALIDNRQG